MKRIHVIRLAMLAAIAAIGLSLTGCGEHAEPIEFEVPGNHPAGR